MRIVGPPTVEHDALLAALRARSDAHPRFVDEMLDPLWRAALHYAVDPLGVVAQSYHETGGGRYDGNVPAEFFNTCGLKIRRPGIFPETTGDQPLAHAQFGSWDVGAEAQCQHLRAYAGCPIEGDLVVDPRYVWVIGRTRLATFEELGGRWAPSPTYGTEVVALATQLREVA